MKKRVCLLVTLLAILIMGFAMSVEAAEAPGIIDQGYCGGEGDGTNLTWTLDNDGVLVIEGQGKMKDWRWEEVAPSDPSNHLTDWHKYYEGIYSVIVRDDVTSIGNYGFSYCTSLNSINLPESLTSIGGRAFSKCYSLSSINLPESITSIGDETFSNCGSLRSIVIPESVTSIGDNAFSYCTSLSSIVIPESVTSIGDNAFHFCYTLGSIQLPESLTSIGDRAFFGCYSLSGIYIPSNVKTINESAFLGTGLKNIYYAGTENEWNSIQIISTEDESGYYNGLRNSTVYYKSLPFDYYLVDAASYNKDLALVAANLSLKAYNLNYSPLSGGFA